MDYLNRYLGIYNIKGKKSSIYAFDTKYVKIIVSGYICVGGGIRCVERDKY